jgi:transcriptional regulator with XRE-family HTH domain
LCSSQRKPHRLAQELRALRKDQNLTLADVAKTSGWAVESIWQFEVGRRVSNFQLVYDLAQALGYELKLEKLPCKKPNTP